MDDTNLQRLHAIIEGRVQGVGFRYFILESASEQGVTGWVRNRWDGSVEVLAEGERSTLEKLLAALYRGPRSSFVTSVHVSWEAASGEWHTFQVTGST
jgi:acylphosphatase